MFDILFSYFDHYYYQDFILGRQEHVGGLHPFKKRIKRSLLLLFKERKDKTYTDSKPAQSARFLERNTRFKLIVNSVDVSNSSYLIQIINN